MYYATIPRIRIMVDDTDSGLVSCQRCKAPIGRYAREGRQVWLAVGELTLSAAHGRCSACGEPFHWSASDKMLEELLARCRGAGTT